VILRDDLIVEPGETIILTVLPLPGYTVGGAPATRIDQRGPPAIAPARPTGHP
jgi:hypothetical protein